MKSRDNFTKSIIAKLERRVNGHCSNPDCRVPTSGPASEADKANCIGVAAHITAASSGGPRYDASISKDQRIDIKNAIWLCVNCATRIDRDPDKYPVSLLENWRRIAEQTASEELGLAPITRKRHEVLNALVFGDLPKRRIADAVSTACEMTVEKMQEMDPRFNVDISHVSGQTCFSLLPKEDVDFKVTITPPFIQEFHKKYSALIDHGQSMEISAQAVRFSGSPLFELVEENTGKLIMGPTAKKHAVCKIAVLDSDEQLVYRLDDIHGEFVSGTKSGTFSGAIFGGMLSVTSKLGFRNYIGSDSEFTINNDFSGWDGKSLAGLPYFNNIFNFYEALLSGGIARISLEFEGEILMQASGVNFINQNEVRQVLFRLLYTRNIRAILKFLELDFLYSVTASIDRREFEKVEYLYALTIVMPSARGTQIGGLSFTLGLSEKPIDEVVTLLTGGIGTIRVEQSFSETLNIFGTTLTIPLLHFIYTNVKSKKPISKHILLKKKTIKVNLVPTSDCSVYISKG